MTKYKNMVTTTHGYYRSGSQMKQKLWGKIFSAKGFKAFQIMAEAGMYGNQPQNFPYNITPELLELQYGTIWSQLVTALITSFINSQINPITNPSLFSTLPPLPSQYSESALNGILKAYDQVTEYCSSILSYGFFDKSTFDNSVYSPGDYYYLKKLYCQNALKNFFNTTQSSSINWSSVNQNVAQIILVFPQIVNSVIDGGFALDYGFLDRSALPEQLPNGLYKLSNNFIVQNLSQAFGFVLDSNILDFNFLVNNNPLLVNSLTNSLFGSLFILHFYDPSPGKLYIHFSQYAENYNANRELFQQIFKNFRRKYPDPSYGFKLANAFIQLIRYGYTANYSYKVAPRVIYDFNQFLQFWINKWTSYGVKKEDLEKLIPIAQSFIPGSSLEAQRKNSQHAVFLQLYKPYFYNPNFKNVIVR